MELVVTPVYVALTAILMVVLGMRVALSRPKYKVSLGDGGNDQMNVILRGFGNLIEYAPIVLLLLLMMEMKGISQEMLHLYGGLFILFRIVHPISLFGKGRPPKLKLIGRQTSATGTFVLMLVGAVTLLIN